MTYQYYIDKEHNCVFTKNEGEIGFKELWKQLPDLMASPDYVEGMNFLRDITSATLDSDYDLAGIKSFMESRPKDSHKKLGSNRRVAWLVDNARDFKITHQFCTLTRNHLTIVTHQPFRNAHGAMTWLGLPEDYAINYPDE